MHYKMLKNWSLNFRKGLFFQIPEILFSVLFSVLTPQQVKTISVSTYAHNTSTSGWLEQSNTVLHKDANFRFAVQKLRNNLAIYYKHANYDKNCDKELAYQEQYPLT